MKTRVCLKYFVNDFGCLVMDVDMDGFRLVAASSR